MEKIITVDANEFSESAKDAIRLNFNPSGNKQVHRLKMLAAALIHEYENVKIANPAAAREAAVAITNAQTASMWGVLAATKGL